MEIDFIKWLDEQIEFHNNEAEFILKSECENKTLHAQIHFQQSVFAKKCKLQFLKKGDVFFS